MSQTHLRQFLPLGLLQGIALWALYWAFDGAHWPSTQPMLFGALVWPVVVLPIAHYLTEATATPIKRRQLYLTVVAFIYSGMGAYAAWLATPLQESSEKIIPANPQIIIAAVIAGFISVPLVAAWDSAKKRFDYAALFTLSWRNGLLCVSVGALTGLFWAVLFAGALLMKSLGLDFVYQLIEKPWFIFPATATVVAIIFANGIARADLLESLRRFWLSLNAWLLPLLMLFSVMWVVALPFTGLDTLFATQQAAFYLLWFCILAVKFTNAAWQDGISALPFPSWLAKLIAWVWPSMVLVAVVALWALNKRVTQYGWTEDRIWASFIALLALLYSVGYALSLWPKNRQRWMASIGTSNIVVALTAISCLLLFNSPLVDPRRLAVQSQLDRLHSGKVSPTEFDYRYLRWEAGRWGLLALSEMSQQKSNANALEIASRATQVLAQKNRWNEQSGDELLPVDVAQRITIYPQGAHLDNELLNLLRDSNSKQWQTRDCLKTNNKCLAWINDADHNGQQEVFIVSANSKACCAQVLLFEQQASGWTLAALYHGKANFSAWESALNEQKITTTAPRWPDLKVGEHLLEGNARIE